MYINYKTPFSNLFTPQNIAQGFSGGPVAKIPGLPTQGMGLCLVRELDPPATAGT